MPPTRRARRKSRKSAAPATTIPELKVSFDKLEDKVQDILRSKSSPLQQVHAFQAAWRSIFHRPVDAAAAESYLAIKRRTCTHGQTRKAGRVKQKGGAATPLSGAPLDYQTAPGIYGSHGTFPTYQVAGLGFYDMINKDGLASTCGQQDITPNPAPAQTQGGGGVGDFLTTITNRPFGTGAGLFGDIQNAFLGRAPAPSPVMDQGMPTMFSR
jgi:hypothetical protein